MFDALEPLRFTPGPTEETTDGVKIAQIHVTGEELWLARIQVFGDSTEEVEHLRDRLIHAWHQPHKAEFFQWESKVCPGSWTNCTDDEVASLHAQGFNIRGCYLRAKP